MGQSTAEKPLQTRNRNHQEAPEVQAGELEEVAPEVQVEVLVEGLEQVALEVQAEVLVEALDQADQADQGEEAPVAAVVVAAAAEVEETLWTTPTEAESEAMMMMTTPMMIQTRSPRQIHQGGRAHDKNRANLVVAELVKVASNPE